jgi:hypothetical protein
VNSIVDAGGMDPAQRRMLQTLMDIDILDRERLRSSAEVYE